MKNYWYRTGILTLGLLALTGCGTSNQTPEQTTQQTSSMASSVVEPLNTGEISEKHNTTHILKSHHIIDYVDYDKIIVGRNNDYANDPRYANITPDGAMDWRQEYNGGEREDLAQFFEHITVNGKPISLPTTFADINPDLAAFDKIDMRNVTEENLGVVFKNNTNNHFLTFKTILSEESESHLGTIAKDDIGLMKVDVGVDHSQAKRVWGLFSDISLFPQTYDLRVSGIGVGSTFNEMYEALGKPSYVLIREGGLRDVVYTLGDDEYLIYFLSYPVISDPFNGDESQIYENVITTVSVHRNEKGEE